MMRSPAIQPCCHGCCRQPNSVAHCKWQWRLHHQRAIAATVLLQCSQMQLGCRGFCPQGHDLLQCGARIFWKRLCRLAGGGLQQHTALQRRQVLLKLPHWQHQLLPQQLQQQPRLQATRLLGSWDRSVKAAKRLRQWQSSWVYASSQLLWSMHPATKMQHLQR